jgi:ABC-2 type transport system permease protein
VIAGFFRQLGWELRRLWRRPRTWAGFVACAVFELVMIGLYRLPTVQAAMLRQVWRLPEGFDRSGTVSGLAIAFEVTAEMTVLVAPLFLALVAADLIGKEAEDGTLRMVLCRPVSRGAVLTQKLLACGVYTTMLALFLAATTVGMAVAVHGTGRFAVVIVRESILGMMDFEAGLARFALAMPFFVFGLSTIPLFAFALSCLPIKPGTAATIALAVLLADWTVRVHPAFAAISPYCLTTRMATWRQFFSDDVPWLRIARNMRQLAWIDAALIAGAWAAFRRRDLTAR